jgi:anti-anti-sigma regulatory factor
MTDSTEEACNARTVTFTGDLTIENVQELHQKLSAALDEVTQLTLAFADVTAVDLGFVQLLCSAHRTAVRAGKVMTLDSRRPQIFHRSLKEMGFLRDRGCVLDSQGSCIWKTGWV